MGKIKKRKPLTKLEKIILDIIIAVLVLIIVISAYKLIDYAIKTKQSVNDTASLVNDAVVYEEENTDELESTDNQKEPSAPYYAKIPSSIDFDKLLSVNSEIEGWLFSQNGVINYPVLRGREDGYYLDHLYNGRKNANGSLFTDAVNAPNFGSQNTVIHGHSMNNGTMFGTLLRYKRQGYYDTYKNMYLYTPDGNYRIDFFAGVVTKTNDIWYTTGFRSEEEFNMAVEYAKEKSKFKSDVTPDYSDKTVTLSTCDYDFKDARFILIGKLVPIS